jgi:hypothetical protein
VAPRHHTKILVGRLMQKGPRKRHLAAEAFTTRGPPTIKWFRFLLGTPTYIVCYVIRVVWRYEME